MRAFITVVILALVAAGSISAQTVRGVVVDDSTKLPLEAAIVTLLNTNGAEVGKPAVRSDSMGRFILHAGEMGRYKVRVTRIGYQPLTSQNVSFTFGGAVTTLTLGMTAAPTKLGSVVVTGTSRLSMVELMSHVGYDLRKSKGNGKFLDSAELARYGREPVAWILDANKVLYGLEFVTSGRGFEIMRMMRGSGTCDPEVWIDGFQANPGGVVARLSSFGADLIYGIEVYNGLQLPPPSLGGEMGSLSAHLRPQQRCGALAIWTKAYVKQMQAKADAEARKRGGG